MNATNFPRPSSAISRLLDMLIQHGTLPGLPIPEFIIEAQMELAGLELQVDLLHARIAELEKKLKEALEDERELP